MKRKETTPLFYFIEENKKRKTITVKAEINEPEGIKTIICADGLALINMYYLEVVSKEEWVKKWLYDMAYFYALDKLDASFTLLEYVRVLTHEEDYFNAGDDFIKEAKEGMKSRYDVELSTEDDIVRKKEDPCYMLQFFGKPIKTVVVCGCFDDYDGVK